jgi:hypothetical protein
MESHFLQWKSMVTMEVNGCYGKFMVAMEFNGCCGTLMVNIGHWSIALERL